jgi:hypothetical protein
MRDNTDRRGEHYAGRPAGLEAGLGQVALQAGAQRARDLGLAVGYARAAAALLEPHAGCYNQVVQLRRAANIIEHADELR